MHSVKSENPSTTFTNTQVSKYHRCKTRTLESARKVFHYRRSNSRQVRIFNLAIEVKTYRRNDEKLVKNFFSFKHMLSFFEKRRFFIVT